MFLKRKDFIWQEEKMAEYTVLVENVIVTEHTVTGDTCDEASAAALRLAREEVPRADERTVVEIDEIE